MDIFKRMSSPGTGAQKPAATKVRKADFVLKRHDHGKARVRVLKVKRQTPRHEVSEFTVATTLYSDEYSKCYFEGDNADLVATDTQKNTIYCVAKRSECKSPEDFAIALCEHFLTQYPVLSAIEAEVDEKPWGRAVVKGKEHDHAFLMGSGEVARAHVKMGREGEGLTAPVVTSSIQRMNVLKTTQSGFAGFLRDEYTLLPDCKERCLATELSATWTYVSGNGASAVNFPKVRSAVREEILLGLFGPAKGGVFSKSLQATVYDAGCLVLAAVSDVEDISIFTPNVHYLPMRALADLGNGGEDGKAGEDLKFEDDIFIPTSEPSGTISCTVSRS